MVKTDGLGARLRDARLALGLTQTQAAEGIVTGAFLSLVESGQRTPSPKVAEALSARLRVSMEQDAAQAAESSATVGIEVALRLGDWKVASDQLDALSAESPARWYYQGMIEMLRGEYSVSLDWLDVVANSPAATSALRLRAKAAICRCSRSVGDLFRSIEVGERALADAQSDPHADAAMVAEIRATLAGTYCETGDLIRAHQLTQKPADEEERDPWSQATQRWSRSMVLQTMGEFAEARALAFEALGLLQQLDRPRSAALLQNTAAWIAMQTPGFDPGEVDHMLRSSEQAFREAHAPIDLALTLSSRAELAIRTGQVDAAIKLITESMRLAHGEEAGLRARLTAIAAQIYAVAGQMNQAMQLLRGARELLEDAGAKRSAAATWRHMAQTYEDLGELDLTVACLKAATDLLGLQPPLQTPVQSGVMETKTLAPREAVPT